MKTVALIEKGSDGSFGVFTPDLESTIIGNGSSVSEAKADFENTFKEILEAYSESNEPLPAELQNIEFEYRFDVASLFDYFDYINVSKFARKAGLNASLLRQYKVGGTYISENQVQKIETALHNCGKELLSLNLIAR